MIVTGVAAAQPPMPSAEAERWVALVDAGHYVASWSAAGTAFRAGVTKKAWVDAVAATRKPLGRLVSREILTEKASKTLPGAPDGDYDVLQFSTAFENKKAAVETMVLSNEPAGWRVVGYFVK